MRLPTIVFFAALTLNAQVTLPPTDDRAEVALQAAIRTEIVDGDLKSAIQQYEAISRSGNRKAAAQALVKMGRCYQKLGDAQAAGVFERVIRDFADQPDSVQQAQRSLTAINIKPAPSAPPAALEGNIGWYNGDWCHCAPGLRNQDDQQ
jgi:outer membrane protein assembly factor BamD (BamD/ComL family)